MSDELGFNYHLLLHSHSTYIESDYRGLRNAESVRNNLVVVHTTVQSTKVSMSRLQLKVTQCISLQRFQLSILHIHHHPSQSRLQASQTKFHGLGAHCTST